MPEEEITINDLVNEETADASINQISDSSTYPLYVKSL
jgi:hypothetical protein